MLSNSRPAGTLVSIARFSGVPDPSGVDTERRESDWNLGGYRRRILLAVRSAKLAWRARHYESLVLVTAGLELFVVALLRRKRTVAVDWLMPESTVLDRFCLLRRVEFVVIRRTDLDTLKRRFGAKRARFVPFPSPVPAAPSCDKGYVYAAGSAHRDWPTFMDALRELSVPAIVSADTCLESPPNVQVLPQQSPETGRDIMAKARVVVLPFVDTLLPSGPLVPLDAMAHGKAIVTSDVGGTRDYVTHGVEALVVPPGDAAALAAAIDRMWKDENLRLRLGGEARKRASTFTAERFWRSALAGSS